jgi:hypothetical protein
MFDENTLQRFLIIMNQHLPVQRRSLAELLLEAEPSYEGKDGHRYRLDRKELEYIASLLEPSERSRFRLPILLMSDTGYETGAWKVEGKLEVKVMSRILGIEPDTEERMRFYYPHLNDLRRRLPTSTTVMFLP